MSNFVQGTGHIAYTNGYDLEDNPYDMWASYDKFHEWREGWFAAEDEMLTIKENIECSR